MPPEFGCCGWTAHRRLRAWGEAGIWDRLHAALLASLRRAGKLDPDTVIVVGVTVRAFGDGETTGPSPVDRRKKGTKHTLTVDRHGVPPVIRTARSNASDHYQILPTVLEFPRVGGMPGKLKRFPADLYNNRGYNSEATRALLRWPRIEPHIAKRRTGPWGRAGQGSLGGEAEHQLAEGTTADTGAVRSAWLIVGAWTKPAADVICFRTLNQSVV